MFYQNMRDFGNPLPFMSLPRTYNGWGFPMPLELRLRWIPNELQAVVCLAYRRRKTPEGALILRALRAMSQPQIYVRGTLDLYEESPFAEILMDYGHVQSLSEIEAEHGITYDISARMYDRLKKVGQLGYLRFPNILDRPHIPYWERVDQVIPGWKTAPYEERFRNLRKRIPESLALEIGSTEEIQEALLASVEDLLGEPQFIHRDSAILVDNDGVNVVTSLNLAARGLGSSLSLQLPNSNFFRSSD